MSENEILTYCKKKNIGLLIADMGGANIFDFEVQEKNFALVIGNEGQGVSANFKVNGFAVSLPMKSSMESLNAGISASVLMYVLMGKDI